MGVLSTAELRACGLTRGAITTRRARGLLHQIHTGVWAVGHPSPSPEGLLLAAVKACGPGALLSHRAAAQLWGFLDPADRLPEVIVTGPGTRMVPGLVVHRTTVLEPRDTLRHRGIPVTTPARTLLDLAAVAPFRELRQAVRRAQGRRRVAIPQLIEAIDRLGPRRGSRRLAKVIATGAAPTNTVLEDIVLDLLLGAGIAHPNVNRPLVIAGRRVVPDFRWPERRLVVEADGGAWHDQKIAREDDAERQALLEAHGERVIRVTWHQSIARRPETIRRILAAGAPLATDRGA
jgi:very-short-patch-repair endonuclease